VRTIQVADLRRFCMDALQSVGVSESDASISAEVLVTTDTWGTYSHGTYHLPNYVNKIRAGGIDPVGKPEILVDGPTFSIVDGHAAMGQVASCMAMEIAIEKARSHGLAYVGVRNSNHFGAAGYYANMAVREGMIGLAMSNADVNMAAPGSKGSVIGNNPFAYAVPAGEEWPIFLDIALSATAATKIFAAKAQGEPIPDNWIVDGEGRPTSDATNWPAVGSLLPMGGHKGYGLAVMVEVVAAVLSGGSVTQDVKSWLESPSAPPGLAHGFLVINASQIMSIEKFKKRIDRMIRAIKDSSKAAGSNQIYLPGEIEWKKREIALKEGILLPQHIVAVLTALAESAEFDTQHLFDK
jgi:ureidoglycolate dehydrogenase (NAD+)